MSIETPDLETLDNLNNTNETQSKGMIQKFYAWSGSWTEQSLSF